MEKTRMHVESDEENVLEKLTSVPTVQFTEFVEDASQNGKTGIATQNYISDKAREMQRKAYQNPR